MTDDLQLFTEPAPTPDPGVVAAVKGKAVHVRTGLTDWGRCTAVFDRDERFRYRLSHERVDGDGPRVCWVMLNPSTATETILDPTVKRTLGFADGWGYRCSEVVNLFAYRSTDPTALYSQQAAHLANRYENPAPVGTLNDAMIAAAAERADLVIAAWGNHGQFGARCDDVLQMLWGLDIDVHYLTMTKAGLPGHPLYVKGDTTPHIMPRVHRNGAPG